jgi:RHS repeat-associated protein
LADSAGAVQTEYTYAPFGTTTVSGQASTNPHQFTGREAEGTGLYSYRARYYHPALSRFLSEDPLRWGEGANFYGYVWNNPVNLLDPLGLAAFRNNSGRDIPYKPENQDSTIGLCKSGTWCNVDGVYSPPYSDWQCIFKIPDNCVSWANSHGELKVICLLPNRLGGPSVVTPGMLRTDPFKNWPDPYGPDPEWPDQKWDPSRTCGCGS